MMSEGPYHNSRQQPSKLRKLEVLTDSKLRFTGLQISMRPFVNRGSDSETSQMTSRRHSTILFKTIRKLVGMILLWDEVKRRALRDALDKCCGNYPLAAGYWA
jgi:hypothetical protein